MTILDRIPSVKTTFFKVLFEIGEEHPEKVIELDIPLRYADAFGDVDEREYHLVYKHGETPRMELSWVDENERSQRETIFFKSKPSNLGDGITYYFVCPRTGALCRRLYFTDRYITSRNGFRKPLYLSQARSHKQRDLFPTEPYRENGKMYYRGKLTPYGKRVERYEQKMERAEEIQRKAFEGLFGKILRKLQR